MDFRIEGPGSSDEQKEGDFTSSLELLTRFSEFSRRIDAEKLKAESLLPFLGCVQSHYIQVLRCDVSII